MFRIATLCLFTLSLASTAAFAAEAKVDMNPVFSPYETIRMALVHDKLDGVDVAAKTLAASATKLAAASDDANAKQSLQAVAGSAEKMASAKDIESARKSFGDLSDAMLRYRDTIQGERPFVAFCAMANKSWLQPDEKIGNPYYGQSMASCGQIVADSK